MSGEFKTINRKYIVFSTKVQIHWTKKHSNERFIALFNLVWLINAKLFFYRRVWNAAINQGCEAEAEHEKFFEEAKALSWKKLEVETISMHMTFGGAGSESNY